MSFRRRSFVATVLLGLGALVQAGAYWHLEAAGPLPDVALARPLAEIMPLAIGDWAGQDVEIGEDSKYGDDYLKRVYFNPKSGEQVTLWMAYSRIGADRGHHPEICLSVLDWPEIPAGRGNLELPGHEAKVQQFLFGRSGQKQWIFYWYYTLKPPNTEGLTQVQRLYQRTQRRYSSVTLEVFAEERSPRSRESAAEFVALVDQLMQPALPDTAVRGSHRSPVKEVDAH